MANLEIALWLLPVPLILPLIVLLKGRPVPVISILLVAILAGPVATLGVGEKQLPLTLHDQVLLAWLLVDVVSRRTRLGMAETRVLAAQVGFLVCAVISTCISSPDLLRSGYALKGYAAGPLAFYLCVKNIRRLKQVRQCARLLVAFGLGLGVELAYFVLTDTTARGAWQALMQAKNTAQVTFGLSNFVAGLLLPLVPLAMLGLGSRRGGRLLGLATALTLIVCIVVTASRGALLSLGVGSLLCAALRSKRGLRNLLATGACLAAAWVLLPDDYLQHLVTKLLGIGRDANTAERLMLWTRSWQLFTENPVIGIGLKASGYAFVSSLSLKEYTEAHNWILTVLAETGLTGASLYILSILTPYVESVRIVFRTRGTRLQDLAFALCMGLTCTLVHGLAEILHGAPQYSVLLWMIFALVYALRNVLAPCRQELPRAAAVAASGSAGSGMGAAVCA